jgi:DNA-binding response OmpR family regulator
MRLASHTGGGSVGLPIWALSNVGPVRLMLVDDDSDEAEIISSLLKRVTDVQYTLDYVSTFSEGLAAIVRDEHDAYIIDHQLGGRTGVELVREARKLRSFAALIILTGQRDRATDLAAMDAGATEFLLKGKTDPALLDRTLRYAISQAAMASTLERSRSQIAGLEELGQILVRDGLTPATIGRVVDLIVEHFALPRVAIYLADGDTLHLAGQHGHEDARPIVSCADPGVQRVLSARHGLLVPSLTPKPGTRSLGAAVATELSVPLILEGELVGLLNVASLVAAPIGELDYAALRLVADRLTAAIAITRERDLAEARLSKALRELRDAHLPAARDNLVHSSSVYQRAMLEPLLEVAIASAGTEPSDSLGLLLVACEDTEPDNLTRFAQCTRTVFAKRPLVGFAASEIAVLVATTDEQWARSGARQLTALAAGAGLSVWCGYAALASGWGPGELIAAAETALEYARRGGPGSVIS